MQDAFQAFMLGGRKKKKTSDSSPKKPNTPKHTPPKTVKASPSPSRHYQKQQQQDYRSFQNLQQEWLETDDTLYELVCSVADLRQRLFYSMQEQQRCVEKQKEHATWKSFGFRPQPSSKNNDPAWLQPKDFDLALDHSLLQHEKALQNLRRLLGQQSQTIDSMGRRLEFLLMGEDYYLECQDSFRNLARELFRKQLLAQRLFASVQDTLLTSLDPWETARACQKAWRV